VRVKVRVILPRAKNLLEIFGKKIRVDWSWVRVGLVENEPKRTSAELCAISAIYERL
jgi:hypothetical protein